MPPMPVSNQGHVGPSTIDKLKLGALMGGSVGAIMGFIYGTITIFRYGAGPSGIGRTLGQYMLTSGTTFGFFMAIGSVIRNDASESLRQAYAQRRPMIVMKASSEPRRPIDVRSWRQP